MLGILIGYGIAGVVATVIVCGLLHGARRGEE